MTKTAGQSHYAATFMCYLLYLHAIRENIDVLQNSYSKLIHIQ